VNTECFNPCQHYVCHSDEDNDDNNNIRTVLRHRNFSMKSQQGNKK